MEAIILAGGFGTRLRSVVSDVPKPMAPIRGVPFLTYIMNHLQTFDVNHVVLSTGFLHDQIANHFGNRYGNIKLSYSQEMTPLGTGGAIKKALAQIEEPHCLILNGDTLFNVDIKRMIAFHIEKKSDITLAVKTMYDFDRYGTIERDGTRVVDFIEKTRREFGAINGGVYIVNSTIFDEETLPESFSFETGFMEPFVTRKNIQAFESDAFFIDIGIPEDYQRAQKVLE